MDREKKNQLYQKIDKKKKKDTDDYKSSIIIITLKLY